MCRKFAIFLTYKANMLKKMKFFNISRENKMIDDFKLEDKLRLLRVWLNHYKVHRHLLSKSERKAFLTKFMTMGKELKSELKAT